MSSRNKRNRKNLANPVPNLNNNNGVSKVVSAEDYRKYEAFQRRLYELERLVDELKETWFERVYPHIRDELQVDSVGDEIGSIACQMEETIKSVKYGNNKHKKSKNKFLTTPLKIINGNQGQNNRDANQKNNKRKEDKKPRKCDIELVFITVEYQ